jgi:hypothetical protein
VAEEEVVRASLSEQAAYQLSNVTKSAPQFGAITPRWLVASSIGSLSKPAHSD